MWLQARLALLVIVSLKVLAIALDEPEPAARFVRCAPTHPHADFAFVENDQWKPQRPLAWNRFGISAAESGLCPSL